MSASRYIGLILTAAALSASGCKNAEPEADTVTQATTAAHPTDPVESAMAAAPEAIGKNAAIVAIQEDGSMKTLRDGTNGFTCMPDNPVTPGPDPMCMDANALAWGMAWMKHETPPAEMPGFMYMLAGGTDASNTDPFAERPKEGDNWIETGPHVMIVGSAKALAGYPSDPKPDTSQPYVMWAGTPYAHLMIPVR